jgi:hypothetical protein
MAVDTRDKRFSMMGISQPVPSVYPNPDAAIGTADRAHWIFLYSGIALSALVYTSYGLPFLYTAANWAQITFYLEAYLKATTGTVYFRLYNETDGAEVLNSEVSTTSAVSTRLRTAALSMADGKVYRLQFGKSGSDAGETYGGKLIGIDNS